ncbi:hypothetical protein HD597_005526 [Nonomuraea thailandensis]|uniref:Spore-associated protein A n=1 Tax=Nonomuraea thailandensis TaxID=1188745 RepID=A0A9X2GGK9_9ACTN|nr:hypothetical protein [Nonomuraea thailandensis]MCP2358506.1 hypothetical protein [Nonomuraea thailandensis]
MRTRKSQPAKTLILSTALVSATVLANPGPAQAAAYSPEAACTETVGYGGWTGLDSRPVKIGSSTWGRVYLLWNGSRGTNCVATIKTSFVGVATYTQATLKIQGVGSYSDPPSLTARKYQYYAAVVRSAAGKCVDFAGRIADTRVDYSLASGARGSYGNCG